jgi:hypothetical protein
MFQGVSTAMSSSDQRLCCELTTNRSLTVEGFLQILKAIGKDCRFSAAQESAEGQIFNLMAARIALIQAGHTVSLFSKQEPCRVGTTVPRLIYCLSVEVGEIGLQLSYARFASLTGGEHGGYEVHDHMRLMVIGEYDRVAGFCRRHPHHPYRQDESWTWTDCPMPSGGHNTIVPEVLA